LLLNRIDRNLNEQAAGDQNAEYFSNTLRSSNVQQRRMLIVELLNDSINRILGTDASVEPPADRPLTDQGFDSLMAVQLTNALGRKLNQRLPVSIVFNYPTVTNLTDYLLTLYEEKLASNEANNDNANASDAAKLLLQDLEQLLK
jgi:acyl carrier protein